MEDLLRNAGAIAALVAAVILILRFRTETHRVRVRLTYRNIPSLPGEDLHPDGTLEATFTNLGRETQLHNVHVYVGGIGVEMGVRTPGTNDRRSQRSHKLPAWLRRGAQFRTEHWIVDAEASTHMLAATYEDRSLNERDLEHLSVMFEDAECRHEADLDKESRSELLEYLRRRADYARQHERDEAEPT